MKSNLLVEARQVLGAFQGAIFNIKPYAFLAHDARYSAGYSWAAEKREVTSVAFFAFLQ